MGISTLSDLITVARSKGPKRVALVGAGQAEILASAVQAQQERLAELVLLGDRAVIEGFRREGRLALDGIEVVHEPSPRRCAYLALEMVRDGSVDLVMNGGAAPNFLVRAALDPAVGLRAGRTLSDVSVFEIPGLDRLILVSDILVVATPSLEDKVGIVQNAIEWRWRWHRRPKVAPVGHRGMVTRRSRVGMDAGQPGQDGAAAGRSARHSRRPPSPGQTPSRQRALASGDREARSPAAPTSFHRARRRVAVH